MQTKQPSVRNPYLAMLAIAWKYARNERRRYLLVYALFMLSNVAMAMYPVIWGLFINAAQQQGADVLKSAWKYGLAYLGIRFIDWSFHGPARLMERELAFNLSRNFLQELYHKALHLPVRWHQDNHSGATINRIRKAYEALRDFFQNGFEYLHTFFKFVFSFAAMIYFAPVFGLVAVAMGFVVVFIILKFDKPYIATQTEVNERENVVSSTLFDSLSNIITVITLRLEKRMESGLLRKVADILPPFKRNVAVNEWKWFVTDMLVGLIYAVILVGYVWQNWKPGEVFLLGGLVMLVGYVERFTSVFHNVAYLYTDVVKHHTDVKQAYAVLDAYDEHHLPESDHQLPENWQIIDIQNLNFTHRGYDEAVLPDPARKFVGLKNIHLRLKRGQRIALVGESGSGKSTILALLRGLYPAEPGVRVTVDGQPQNSLDIITGDVTLFPQEPEIFENTIEYNITLGLPFEPAELDAICRTVHFSEVIEQLPKGLQSSIMEKGVNLSGGQKQRLALARGVFAAKDSDLILLDEPTSSVDPKTEMRIYARMFEAFADKVVVSALHRLHLLPKFDYIYVLDQGEVADEGTLEALLERSAAFRELWRHQEEAGALAG
ncbi:MAG: ABC transporter ATP-binding protein [Saprospiraceae bacterium]|nr:ABC transporter ATP-binding protein [Saprospiraceae bacterium]